MNDNTTTITKCANCGKCDESSGDLKACVACKLVKYCNRECQIAHRPLHKKACKKRAAELHDEALFKEHPPREDCPICLVPLPLDMSQAVFKSCCGKIICNGCWYVMAKEAYSIANKKGTKEVTDLCAFCRTSASRSSEEEVQRIQKYVEAGNAQAINALAVLYFKGDMDVQKDYGPSVPIDFAKANELYLRAGELGCAEGYCNLGYSYNDGRGVEVDKKKAKHYWELAAMNGNVKSRLNLGRVELEARNYHRAKKHFIIASNAGCNESLDRVKEGFMRGHVTKDEYVNTLRAHQERHDEMKSDERDKGEEFYQQLGYIGAI